MPNEALQSAGELVYTEEMHELFRSIGSEYGLSFEPQDKDVPPLTPLLAGGRLRLMGPKLTGSLPGGVDGTLACLYQSSDPSNQTYYRLWPFTVVVTEIPESTYFVPRLICERRGRKTIDHLPAIGDRLRATGLDWDESEVSSRRYKITIAPHQDRDWISRMFSSSFSSWLESEPPEDFSFELVYGTLCANLEGADEEDAGPPSRDRLEALCECSGKVAARIREESRG